ncbi:DMT family transporter [Ammoniphilus resinae]|uniref:Drug/metabolite transporter (DMT)-like permease n=1 Tax=Ammoniphilus resinae TaxID=861532 RepID=A0ABS4GPB7_9BACL|nr:drug/metabolite transporter (DMT)-like permease [Ammoniphilus resinae]
MGGYSRFKTFFMISFLVLVWGGIWPIYKIALAYSPPLLFAGMRTLLGGLLLAIPILATYKRIKWKETWHIFLLSGLFNAGINNGANAVGLIYFPAGLSSVITFLQPVIVSIFAWLWLKEKLTFVKVIGLFLGFLGVLVVSSHSLSGQQSILGILFALINAVSWAFGVIYVKKVGYKVDFMWLLALQFIFGGVILTIAGLSLENVSDIVWNFPYAAGLLYGAIFGAALSWVVYLKLMKNGDTSKVASFTFLVPVIAVFCGTLFLGEPFTLYLVIGLGLIAFSIYLVNRRDPKAGMQAVAGKQLGLTR